MVGLGTIQMHMTWGLTCAAVSSNGGGGVSLNCMLSIATSMWSPNAVTHIHTYRQTRSYTHTHTCRVARAGWQDGAVVKDKTIAATQPPGGEGRAGQRSSAMFNRPHLLHDVNDVAVPDGSQVASAHLMWDNAHLQTLKTFIKLILLTVFASSNLQSKLAAAPAHLRRSGQDIVIDCRSCVPLCVGHPTHSRVLFVHCDL